MKKIEEINYLNISVDDTGICEYEGSKRLLFIKKNEIKKLSYGYGYIFRYPILVFSIGILLVIVGIVWGLLPIFDAIFNTKNIGFRFLKGYGLISIFIIYGAWLANSAFRKKHFILVDLVNGNRKL